MNQLWSLTSLHNTRNGGRAKGGNSSGQRNNSGGGNSRSGGQRNQRAPGKHESSQPLSTFRDRLRIVVNSRMSSSIFLNFTNLILKTPNLTQFSPVVDHQS